MSCLDAFVRDILTTPFTYLKDSFFLSFSISQLVKYLELFYVLSA